MRVISCWGVGWNPAIELRLLIGRSVVLAAHQQVQATKFMPQVTAFKRLLVSQSQVTARREGFQHRQMRGARLVKTGQQAVHSMDAACQDRVAL